jgi:WD40 repeat protein
MRRSSHAAACLLALFLGGALRAETPAADKPALKDCYGDPLPAGASARLGTIRWRLAGSITSVVFPPGGKTVIVAGDGAVRLWELATGRELRRIPCRPNARESSVELTPDGKTLIVTASDWFGKDSAVRHYDLETWKELPEPPSSKEAHPGAYFTTSDGKTLVVGDEKGIISLRDVKTGRERCRLEDPISQGLVFSPDCKTIASIDGVEIQLWDAETGHMLHRLKGHPVVSYGSVFCVNPIGPLVFSPDGKKLVSASQDRSVIVWDVAAGKELHRLDDRIRDKFSLGASPFFSPDSATLFVPGEEAVYLCEAKTGKLMREVRTRGYKVLGLSPDGNTLILGGSVLKLLDFASGKDLLPAFGGHKAELRLIAFLSKGRTVLTVGHDWTVRSWDAATGRQLRQFDTDRAGGGADLSHDGRLLALAEWKGGVSLWDVAKGKQVRGWQADTGPPGYPTGYGTLDVVAFSPDGTTLATGGFDKRVHLWNTATGAEVWHTVEHQTGLSQVLFSPDGKWLASVDGNHWDSAGGFDVYLWDAVTGTQVRRLKGSDKKILGLAFSPDGKTLAVAADHEPIRLWETATWQVRGRLPAPDDYAFTIAFSPNSRLLALTQSGRPTQLWDVLSGEKVAAFDDSGTGRLAFAPDGRTLATSGGTSVLLWPLATDVIARRAMNELTDDGRLAAWKDLADSDAAGAFRAMRILSADRKSAPRFLRDQLVVSADAERLVKRLISRLDDDDFSERERAEKDLRQLGLTAEAALRQALQDSPSAEVHMRADRLTRLFQAEKEPSSEELRGLRAVEVLQAIGDAPAQQALETLGERGRWHRVRQEAAACLNRLKEINPIP